MHFASGWEISIGGLVDAVAEVLGVDVEVELDPERVRPKRSEVERLWADVSRARAVYGWTPQWSGADGLRRGLERTARWLLGSPHRDRYRPDVYAR